MLFYVCVCVCVNSTTLDHCPLFLWVTRVPLRYFLKEFVLPCFLITTAATLYLSLLKAEFLCLFDFWAVCIQEDCTSRFEYMLSFETKKANVNMYLSEWGVYIRNYITLFIALMACIFIGWFCIPSSIALFITRRRL